MRRRHACGNDDHGGLRVAIVDQVLQAGDPLVFARGQQARILSVVAGELSGSGVLARGDNVLLPQAGEFPFVAKTDATILVTENFSDA